MSELHYRFEDGKYKITMKLYDGRVAPVIASAELITLEKPTGIVSFDTKEEAERYCQDWKVAREIRARIIAGKDGTS